jgi:hypothetical protein
VIELVALQPAHRSAVGAIFGATQLLGKPLPFRLDGAEVYERLALDWYFEHGAADGAVAVDAAGALVGYCLVCCDPDHHRRWLRRRTAATVACLGKELAAGRIGAASCSFYRRRLRDALHLATAREVPADAGHAHVNLLAGARDGITARRVRDHVDERCRLAGLNSWFGEVNARAGRRASSLGRVGGEVIARHPNHTFSALLGEPVVRLTMVRRVPARRAAVSVLDRAIPAAG